MPNERFDRLDLFIAAPSLKFDFLHRGGCDMVPAIR